MKVIAIEKESTNTSKKILNKDRNKEYSRVFELMIRNVIKAINCDINTNITYTIECENLETANRILEKFPMVRKGLKTLETFSQ